MKTMKKRARLAARIADYEKTLALVGAGSKKGKSLHRPGSQNDKKM